MSSFHPTATQVPAGAGAVDFHNRLAASWEGKYRKGRFSARLELLKRMLQVQDISNKNWLDAGCGTGIFSRWLAERGASVLAIDAAPAMIEQARQLSSDSAVRGRLSYSVGDIGQLQFADGSFDGVLCSSVLEYVASPVDCLREFERVLRPQGRLILSVPNSRSGVRMGLRSVSMASGLAGRAWPKWIAHSQHQFSRKSILDLLGASGFRTASVEAFGIELPMRIQRFSFVGPLWMISASRI